MERTRDVKPETQPAGIPAGDADGIGAGLAGTVGLDPVSRPEAPEPNVVDLVAFSGIVAFEAAVSTTTEEERKAQEERRRQEEARQKEDARRKAEADRLLELEHQQKRPPSIALEQTLSNDLSRLLSHGPFNSRSVIASHEAYRAGKLANATGERTNHEDARRLHAQAAVEFRAFAQTLKPEMVKRLVSMADLHDRAALWHEAKRNRAEAQNASAATRSSRL